MQDTDDTQLHIQNPSQITHSIHEIHSSHADPTHSIIEGRKNVAWKNQVKQNLRSVLSKTKKINPPPHNDLPSDSNITQKILAKDVPSHDKEPQNRPIIEKPIPSRRLQDNDNIKFSNRSTVSIPYQTHEDESYRILREHNRDNEDLNRYIPSYARNNLLENKENKDYYDIHNISNHNSIVLSSAQRQRKDSNVSETTGYLRKYDKSLISSRLLDQHQPLRENNSYISKYRNEADEDSIYSNRSKVNEFLTRYHLLYEDKGGHGSKSGLYSRGLDRENIYNVSTATSNAQNNTKSRVSEILQDMKQSQEKLKKSYYSYKFDRFRYYLNKIIRAMETRNKKIAFGLILEKSKEKEALIVEYLERREYYLKGKCFNAWNDLVIQTKEEEEKRLEEEARKAQKCVSPRVQNFTTLPNKHQEDDRKHKEEMDEFVMKIKNRHNQILAHQEEFEDEDNVDWGEERLDAFVEDEDEDEYSQEGQEDDEGDYEDYDEEEDIENFDDREMSMIPIPMPHEDIKPPVIEDEEEEEEPIRDQPTLKKQNREKSQERQRRSPVKQEKKQEERQGSKSQEKQQQHQNNKLTIQELEERARERHQKVLEIRRKHHEQKLQKEREKEEAKEREREEQRQKQLEEKRKLEQKKREEQLLKQKKEMEQRRLEDMYEEAKIYDQKRLLRNYGFRWLQRLVQQAQEKVQAAEKLRGKLLKQSGIRRWKRAIEEIENERNEELKGKMKLAEEVYERRLKRLGIKVLCTCLKESEDNLDQYRRHRDHFLQRQCVKAWAKALPEMRKENFYHEAIQDKLLREFNFKRLAKKVFAIWREYVEEEKRSKFKDVQKQYLWNKVNSWLSDYKQKKTPGDEN